MQVFFHAFCKAWPLLDTSWHFLLRLFPGTWRVLLLLGMVFFRMSVSSRALLVVLCFGWRLRLRGLNPSEACLWRLGLLEKPCALPHVRVSYPEATGSYFYFRGEHSPWTSWGTSTETPARS